MPTNEERREVAARLREMARTFSWLNHVSLERAIGVDTDGYSFKESDAIVCNRLADLIEPEPQVCEACPQMGDPDSFITHLLNRQCPHYSVARHYCNIHSCEVCGAKVVG